MLDELRGSGIAIVAASTDPAVEATKTVAELGLTFPVGYGLPLLETAQRIGGFYEERRGILHGTGFLLRSDGSIGMSLYSSGAIGRLVPDDVLRLVRFWRARG